MSAVTVHKGEFKAFFKEMERLEKSLDRKSINAIQTRNARPMLQQMKSDAPSSRFEKVTAITTRQTKRPRAPRTGIRIGVINNNASLFPTFSAPALASVLEYGTTERFRSLKAGGLVTGQVSTGRMTDNHRWIRKAWDSNVTNFIEKTIKSYERKVNG